MVPPFDLEETVILPVEPPIALPVYPTLKESWGAFGWLLLISLLVGGATLVALGGRASSGTSSRLVGLVLGTEVSLVLTTLWVRRRAGPLRWPGIALWGPWEKWHLYALLPVLVLAQDILLSPVSLLHLPSPNAKLYQEMARYPVLLFGIGCFAAPVLEELFFRGILLKGLLHNYRPAVAIGQSALLFGLVHLSPSQSISTTLIGLVIGWVYYRTRSLGLCMSLHIINNLLAFSGMRHARLAGAQDVFSLISPVHYVALLLAAAVVLGGIFWWMHRMLPPVSTLARKASSSDEAMALPPL